jgi:hypothetical protein
MPTSSKWSLSPSFPTKPLCATLIFPSRATCHAHLIILYVITRKTFAEEQRSYSSSLCSFILSPVTLSFLSPNIFLCSLFSNPFAYAPHCALPKFTSIQSSRYNYSTLSADIWRQLGASTFCGKRSRPLMWDGLLAARGKIT